MSKKYELSRRKALAALGTIGVAGAATGLGTSAYFSDTESFTNNSITAGELDLLASWKEVAYQGGGGDNVDLFIDPEVAELPMPGRDKTFQGTTYDVLKVFPGGTGNTVGTSGPGATNDLPDYVVGIENLSDFEGEFVDEEIPTSEAALEDPCSNRGEWVSGDDDPPEIDLSDVKPGDFGEITLDYHLCGNPGYVWLNGSLVSSGENTVVEPEGDDPHEEDGVVELLDAVQTRVWYDDGDNIYEPGVATGASCNVLALDESGSINSSERSQIRTGATQLVNSSDADNNGTLEIPHGLVAFDESAAIAHPLTTNESAIVDEINGTDADSNGETYGDDSGNTDLAGAIQDSVQVYENDGGDVCPPGADKYITLLTDGEDTVDGDAAVESAADAAKAAGYTLIVIGVGLSASSANFLENEVASEDAGGNPLFFGVEFGGVQSAFDQIERIIGAGEEEIFQGSLRELLNSGIASGNGIPLDTDTSSEAFDATENSNTRFVGFEWWVPPNGLNEIQTDSATFDLGFYTEQERNNSAPGSS